MRAQPLLDDVQVLLNDARFAVDLGIRILDQARRRYEEQKSVDRLTRPTLAKLVEEAVPRRAEALRQRPVPVVAEHHASGGVEQDGVVGEPPVHRVRAAGALGRVLQAGREADFALGDGFGLAGARFADDEVPRQVVDAFAGVAELLQAAVELGDAGVLSRGVDGGGVAGAGSRVLLNARGHALACRRRAALRSVRSTRITATIPTNPATRMTGITQSRVVQYRNPAAASVTTTVAPAAA